MFVSIITAAYNSAKTIQRTIESVLNQTYSPLEYIVVDGASTDDTVALARAYEAQFKKRGKILRVISEPDHGMYDALNKGAQLAQGNLIGNINADDWYEPAAVEQMVSFYQRDLYDVAWGNILIHKPSGNMIKKARIGCWWSTAGWCHPAMFAKREVLIDNPYRCENMYDDFEFITRLYASHKKLKVYDLLISHYNFGGMSTQKNLAQVKKRIQMKYAVYRQYGFSRWHWPESVIIELAKYVLG